MHNDAETIHRPTPTTEEFEELCDATFGTRYKAELQHRDHALDVVRSGTFEIDGDLYPQYIGTTKGENAGDIVVFIEDADRVEAYKVDTSSVRDYDLSYIGALEMNPSA